MHGFFIDLRLYSKAKTLANPFAYAEYRQKLISDKLEKERESRIRSVNKGGQPKAAANVTPAGEKITVNKSLVDRLRQKEEKEKEKEARKRKRTTAEDKPEEGAADGPTNLLADDRFSSLFTNPEFAIDEKSREFAMLNPSAAAQTKAAENAEDDDSEGVSEGEDSDSSAEGGASLSSCTLKVSDSFCLSFFVCRIGVL